MFFVCSNSNDIYEEQQIFCCVLFISCNICKLWTHTKKNECYKKSVTKGTTWMHHYRINIRPQIVFLSPLHSTLCFMWATLLFILHNMFCYFLLRTEKVCRHGLLREQKKKKKKKKHVMVNMLSVCLPK